MLCRGDWDYEGSEVPEGATDGFIWRRGTERYLNVDGKWVMSGCYEAQAEFEQLVQLAQESN